MKLSERMIVLLTVASLVAGCAIDPADEMDSSLNTELDSPPMLIAYPVTKNSLLDDALESLESKCSVEECGGQLGIVTQTGQEQVINVHGMIGGKAYFSGNNENVAISDLFSIAIIKDGKIQKKEIETKSPVSNYLEISDTGSVFAINNLPALPGKRDFSSNIMKIDEGKYGERAQALSADFIRCGKSLYAFSTGIIDDNENIVFPEYLLDERSGEFKELRKINTIDRSLLAHSCIDDDSFNDLVSVDGDIRRGIYDRSEGWKDQPEIYPWDDYDYARLGDSARFLGDEVWGLTKSGQMRVFNRRTSSYDIKWEVSKYFEESHVSRLNNFSIQNGDSVFFFGHYKTDKGPWIMIEVDHQTGRIIRSIRIPFFDKLYSENQVDEIYMGDVDKFREWADKQPKFEPEYSGSE